MNDVKILFLKIIDNFQFFYAVSFDNILDSIIAELEELKLTFLIILHLYFIEIVVFLAKRALYSLCTPKLTISIFFFFHSNHFLFSWQVPHTKKFLIRGSSGP